MKKTCIGFLCVTLGMLYLPARGASAGPVDLTGEWRINANNFRGSITITNQAGDRFLGKVDIDAGRTEALVDGTLNRDRVAFTRLWPDGTLRQDFTGALTIDDTGQASMSGTLTQTRAGSYPWSAVKTERMVVTPPAPPPPVQTSVEQDAVGGPLPWDQAGPARAAEPEVSPPAMPASWQRLQEGRLVFRLPPDWQKQDYDPIWMRMDEQDEFSALVTVDVEDVSAEFESIEGASITRETVEVSGFTAVRMRFEAGETRVGPLQGWVYVFDAPLPACGTRSVSLMGRPGMDRLLAQIMTTLEVSSAAAPAAAGEGLPPAEQRTLARELFNEIAAADTWDLDRIEALYLRAMEETPATAQAEEAYWRLGNMYMQAYSPDRNADAIALLERYLELYPGSRLLDERFPVFARSGWSLVEHRLLFLYEKTESWDAAAALYLRLLPDPSQAPEDRLDDLVAYGRAMEQTGRTAEAIMAYRTFLDRKQNPGPYLERSAQLGLERLQARNP